MNTQFHTCAQKAIKDLRAAYKKLSKHAQKYGTHEKHTHYQRELSVDTLRRTAKNLETIIIWTHNHNSFAQYEEEFTRLLSPFFLSMERSPFTGLCVRTNYTTLMRALHCESSAIEQLKSARQAIRDEYLTQAYPWDNLIKNEHS